MTPTKASVIGKGQASCVRSLLLWGYGQSHGRRLPRGGLATQANSSPLTDAPGGVRVTGVFPIRSLQTQGGGEGQTRAGKSHPKGETQGGMLHTR